MHSHADCSSGVCLCDRCSRGRRRAQAQTKGTTAKGWTRLRSVIAFMGEPAHSLLEQSHSSKNSPLLYPCLSFHKVKRSVLCGLGAVTKSDLTGDTTPRYGHSAVPTGFGQSLACVEHGSKVAQLSCLHFAVHSLFSCIAV